MTNKSQGVAAELAVAHELAARGCGVAWPVGDNEPYDLIVTGSSGKLFKTQVKSAHQNSGGTYKVSFAHGSPTPKKYSKGEIDMLVARLPYDVDYPEITQPGYYILPASAIQTVNGVFYAPGHGRYGHWVSRYEKWRNKWELFA